MRINGAIPPSESAQTQNVNRSGNSKSQGTSGAANHAPDQAQLVSDGGKVTQLKAAISQVPEVRDDRIQALRQAMSNGSYHPSSQQLAHAIGSDALAAGKGR
jgi:flagellar biosynthesis anti-sigma factor FlgM